MEMKHWWTLHNEVEREGCTKEEVEDLTGRIPLFLKECVVKGEDGKDKIKLNNTFFQNVYSEVIEFEMGLQEDYKKSLDRYVYYNRSSHITLPTSLGTLSI